MSKATVKANMRNLKMGIAAHFAWNASSVDTTFFTAHVPMLVTAVRVRVEVAGTDGSAVSAVVKKAATGTAITAGTALHSGSVDLKGTAATNQAMTLSTNAADKFLQPGDSLGLDFTGTLTAAIGSVTVHMVPA